MRRRAHLDAGLPVDDARVEAGRPRFLVQQLVPLGARRQPVGERRRRVLAARRGPRQRSRVHDAHPRGRARPGGGALERGGQAGGRRVAGRGVAVAAVDVHGRHRAVVGGRDVGHRDVLADGEAFAALLDEAQRPEVGAQVERGKGTVEGHRESVSGCGNQKGRLCRPSRRALRRADAIITRTEDAPIPGPSCPPMRTLAQRRQRACDSTPPAQICCGTRSALSRRIRCRRKACRRSWFGLPRSIACVLLRGPRFADREQCCGQLRSAATLSDGEYSGRFEFNIGPFDQWRWRC